MNIVAAEPGSPTDAGVRVRTIVLVSRSLGSR
jgi:hypothetical protein